MRQEQLDNFLDDNEKLAIQQFVDSEVMRVAVKKILLWEIYQNGVLKKGEPPTPMRNSALGLAATMDDPTKIGQRLMAMWEGINFLELGFRKLSEYSKVKELPKDKNNPAR